ncbi:protein neprosin-like [Typha angustifolia]|uniref:protein neprosin-like n=1 Tax=Typha angustifolia TaxID=59011 RepID=UPI003C2E1627
MTNSLTIRLLLKLEWAIYKSKPNDKWSYYGAEATLAVYSYPYLKADRSTAGLIGVLYGQGGPRDQFNEILVGWTVDPKFYGDSLARFFISWTADADRKTGCFDLRCEGFRSLNGAVVTPGDVIDPLSTGKGNQSDITIRIFKDEISGDWWLYYGQYDNLSPVGYFPKTLFGGLADRAEQIYFGGHVSFLKGGVSPPMGNGHSLGDGPAYFKGVQYVGQNGQKYLPDELRDYVDNKDCYQVSYFVYDTFHYGGPGGCTN